MTDNSEPENQQEKTEETFCYLDKIKGKSIFGKQELGGNDLKPDDSNIATDSEKSNAMGLDVKAESSEGADQAQETAQSSENDKVKRSVQKNNESSESSFDESSDSFHNELINSVELFPFGTDSYL